jgi:hypothetical protein
MGERENDMDTPRDPRKCEHVNEDGTLCNGWKAKGGRLCAGHAGLGIAASPEAARRAQQAGAARRSEVAERARKRAVDVYRDMLDLPVADVRKLARRDDLTVAEAFAVERVLMALDDSYSGGDRAKAMEQLEARAIGRPTERLEVEQADPLRETLAGLTPEERRAMLMALPRTGTEH